MTQNDRKALARRQPINRRVDRHASLAGQYLVIRPRRAASQHAAINMFSAFGYFDDAENQRVLEEVARVLRPRGQLFIDLINRDSLMRRFEARSEGQRRDGRRGIEEREFDSTMGAIRTTWTVIEASGERITQSHTIRIYTLQEMELRMAQAGLRVEETWGRLDGAELTMDSRRLVIRATKA